MNSSTAVHTNENDESLFNWFDLLHTLADNLRLLVLAPLTAGLVALGISFMVPPTFIATTKFLPPQLQQGASGSALQGLGSLGGLGGLAAAAGVKNPNDQFIAYLQSRSVQDALVKRFKLMARYDSKFEQDARNELSKNIVVTNGKDGIITIEVQDKDPRFAAELANAHVEELTRLLSRLAVTEAQRRRLFFEGQLNGAKDKLIKAEEAVKASGINSGALKANPYTAVENLARLKANVAAQEVKLASMRGYLTAAAPEFKQAQTELRALRDQMLSAERQEPASGNDSGSDYVAKFREFKYFETLFELYSRQYEIAKVDESREGALVQVLDVAQPPDKKSGPKKALITALTILAASHIVLLFIFVRQALRNANNNPESKARLAGLNHALRRSLGISVLS